MVRQCFASSVVGARSLSEKLRRLFAPGDLSRYFIARCFLLYVLEFVMDLTGAVVFRLGGDVVQAE